MQSPLTLSAWRLLSVSPAVSWTHILSHLCFLALGLEVDRWQARQPAFVWMKAAQAGALQAPGYNFPLLHLWIPGKELSCRRPQGIFSTRIEIGVKKTWVCRRHCSLWLRWVSLYFVPQKTVSLPLGDENFEFHYTEKMLEESDWLAKLSGLYHVFSLSISQWTSMCWEVFSEFILLSLSLTLAIV